MKIECKKVSLIGSPEPRWGHTSITLPNGSGFIVFGGNSNRAFNDIQYYNIQNNSWSKIEAVGNTPSERYGHSAALYQSQNRPYSDSYQIIFFGGRATSKPFSDINILYVNITNKSVEGRAGHTSVVYRNYLIVFGGHNNHKSKYYSSVLGYNLDTNEWKQQSCSGVIPSARATHCTFQINNKMFIFGGYDGKKYYNDVYYLDLDTFTWKKVEPKGIAPKPRSGHSATLISNNKLMIFGGCGSDSNFLNDIHILHIDGVNEYHWEQPQYMGIEIPQARFRHTTNFIGGRMYIYAGTGSGNLMGDLHQLEFFDDNNNPLVPIIPSIQTNNNNGIYGSPSNNLLSTSSSSSYLSTSPQSTSSILSNHNFNSQHSNNNDITNDTLSDHSNHSNNTLASNNSIGSNQSSQYLQIPSTLSRSNSNISLNSSTSSLQSVQTTTTTSTTTSQTSNRSNYSNSNRSSISIPHSNYSGSSGHRNQYQHQYQQQPQPQPQVKTNSAEELILEELRSLNIYDQAAGNKDFQSSLRRVEDHFNHKIRHEQKYRQNLEEKLDIDDLPTETCLKLEEIHVKSLEKLRVKKLPQKSSPNSNQTTNNGSHLNNNSIVGEQTIICNNSQISTQIPNQLLSTQQSILDSKQLAQQQQQLQQQQKQPLSQRQVLTSSSSSTSSLSSQQQQKQHRLSISSNSSIISNNSNSNNDSQYYENKIKELTNQLKEKNQSLAEKDIEINGLNKQLNKFKLINIDALDVRELLDLEAIFHNNLRQISTIKDQIYSSRLSVLEKEKDQLKDQNSCVICVTNTPNILLLPCRHSSICSECSTKLTRCPLCRSEITKTLERF
ncbi:hypothetical protein DICPUDRAFT_149727 [Dictyostelium purpureum]|uniref:RING-type domain-containing protein n=1 Tax=Dictyostelium purpureum TaxID=5786 RepID=F0ZEI4_DICPU|nr:uncharacterized protein DICPUDRAFT_149727 [Dictyostelium purpureum]EGC37632.1 hypothetical protein DICPUDRAFT_149727 [Dictyostelium purpureum]|eukprot:XP_003285820.1 hypothetical protein DICPUDRAFT_149727 [Dictyostelium purpureum]